MASLVRVGDADDPRLADYARLTDVHLRRSLEAEHGLFIAEGEKVIRRAIAEVGYPVRSLLVTEDKLAAAEDLVRRWLPRRPRSTWCLRPSPSG